MIIEYNYYMGICSSTELIEYGKALEHPSSGWYMINEWTFREHQMCPLTTLDVYLLWGDI